MFKEMRRSERQLSPKESINVLEACSHGVLSTSDAQGNPYGVPINYFYAEGNIYFHCALEGHKLDNIQHNPRVSFCVMDRSQPLPTSYTSRYRSVIAFGKVIEIFEKEKADCMLQFVRKQSLSFGDSGYHENAVHRFADRHLPNMRMFRIQIERLTGKADLNPSCRDACPAHVNIPGYIALLKAGKAADAYQLIRQENPFPAVCGRVCLHPCEASCIRNEIDQSLAIRGLKRYAADHGLAGAATQAQPAVQPNGKKVAIVGAGPSGLTCGYYLARLGYAVEIFEAQAIAGGVPAFGIPEYRLPKAVLAQEIALIEQAGVTIHLNSEIKDIEQLKRAFAAVYLSVGSQAPKQLGLPGEELPGVYHGLDFLKAVNLHGETHIGKEVVVLGGGSVAFDVARMALRLGAEQVHLACLEARDNMLAAAEEISEAVEEGVVIHNAHSFSQILAKQGRVSGVECWDVESLAFDANKKPRVVAKEGSRHLLPADAVIIAIGQGPKNTAGYHLDSVGDGRICVDSQTLSTSQAGVFAGGDVVRGSVSVISAIADGKQAAEAIDRYLGGTGVLNKGEAIEIPAAEKIEEIGEDYRPIIHQLDAKARKHSLAEIDLGFDHASAITECQRCLRCDR